VAALGAVNSHLLFRRAPLGDEQGFCRAYKRPFSTRPGFHALSVYTHSPGYEALNTTACKNERALVDAMKGDEVGKPAGPISIDP